MKTLMRILDLREQATLEQLCRRCVKAIERNSCARW